MLPNDFLFASTKEKGKFAQTWTGGHVQKEKSEPAYLIWQKESQQKMQHHDCDLKKESEFLSRRDHS